MFCIGLIIASVGVLLLSGDGYGSGLPLRREMKRTAAPERRRTGEERMG